MWFPKLLLVEKDLEQSSQVNSSKAWECCSFWCRFRLALWYQPPHNTHCLLPKVKRKTYIILLRTFISHKIIKKKTVFSLVTSSWFERCYASFACGLSWHPRFWKPSYNAGTQLETRFHVGSWCVFLCFCCDRTLDSAHIEHCLQNKVNIDK